ncbi:MAG: UDP-N-acetylglucosamine 4,6-dehydratase (inverting) [SAR86 cluster bacterium]|nr:UDP-N-acetylglucosamine 4,6-dehydratase (inverting) [SAR86 cluster bacterium]
MFNGKSILITGGTGSFGKAFCNFLRKNYKPLRVVIFSRDEMKQWEMAKDYDEKFFRFFLGDVRDKDRLRFALKDVDFVVHAAAMKIVPTAEYDPMECVKTNVMGAMNVIEECLLADSVTNVVALSTDKASSPINLYGATKLTSDKLFAAANNFKGKKDIKFSVVRYGNVMCSRGSVIPFFQSLSAEDDIPITDLNMTRFMISLEEGVDLVKIAFEDSLGGEIYVRKIPSMKVMDIAEAVTGRKDFKEIGIRLGEKIHEQMISAEESYTTYEYQNYYKILPQFNDWGTDKNRIKDGSKVKEGFIYSSETNKDWMSNEALKEFLAKNKQ